MILRIRGPAGTETGRFKSTVGLTATTTNAKAGTEAGHYDDCDC
jgi:hypothetical protein